MSIETARLIVRTYTEEDLPALARILGDRTTMAFWPRPLDAEESAGWLWRNIASREMSGYGRQAVILKATGALIGDAGVVRAEIDGQERPDLGYIIDHTQWGHGYATEAARALASLYLHGHGCGVLYANMAHDHRASQRVAERIGMRRCGEFANSRNRGIRTFLYLLEHPS
jgi:RimJ/RimL family protein N-acetyltransferase